MNKNFNLKKWGFYKYNGEFTWSKKIWDIKNGKIYVLKNLIKNDIILILENDINEVYKVLVGDVIAYVDGYNLDLYEEILSDGI